MLLKVLRLRGRRAARWISLVFCLLFLLLLAGGLVPSLLGSRLCWPQVFAYLTGDWDGRVTSPSASLGWFSPVVVSDVSIEDRTGQVLARVEELRIESSLLSLLLDPRDLGVIHLKKPSLHIVLREDGSNLEDALASLLAQSPSGEVHGSIAITGGSVDCVDAAQTHVARLTSVDATVQLPSEPAAPGTVTVDRCQHTVGSQAGVCAGRLLWPRGESAPSWSLSTHIEGLGLSCVQAVARRLGMDMRIDGVLTADLDCQWGGPGGRMTLDVREASAQSVRVCAPTWLGRDQLQLQSLRAHGSYTAGDDGWELRGAKVECDAGQFTMDGRCAWQPGAGISVWEQLLRSVAAADLEIDGNVDLARLTQMLPDTLRVREGAAIEAGSIHVQLHGSHDVSPLGWWAKIETSELAAVHDGRRFTWDDPMRVIVEVERDEQGWNVRQLACQLPYLQLTGQGTLAAGSVEMTCDLARLVAELQQLFDLGGMQATGTMKSQLRWQRTADSRVALEGTSTIENLDWGMTPASRWREPHVQAVLSLEAEVAGPRLTSIRSGRVELSAGTDRLEVHLLAAVPEPGYDAVWPIGGLVRGELSQWLTRVRPWLPDESAEGSGSLQLDFTAYLSRQNWDIRQLVFHSEPLRWSTLGVDIVEPTVHVELQGQGDTGFAQGSLPDVLFQSSALAFRATDVVWSSATARPRLAGDVSFRGDLARVHTCWQVRSAQQNWRMAGIAQGQVSLVQQAGTTEARWSLDLVNAELARRTNPSAPGTLSVLPAAQSAAWTTVWKEPALKLVGAGQFDGAREVAQLDRCEVTAAEALTLSVEGNLARPLADCTVDLQGRVTYDLAKLMDRLLPPSGLRMSGQDTQAFALRGPLFRVPGITVREVAGADDPPSGWLPQELTGQGALRWQSIDALGVHVGAGLLSARLAAGVLETNPLEIPLSQGTMRLSPRVVLNNEPPQLVVDAGQVLTDVSITPEMCQGWIKYIAPLVADATRAEGKFSLSLDRAAIPLEQPAAAEVVGVLQIDSAQVGPGPLAQQFISLGKQIEALIQGRLPSAATGEPMTWVRVPRQETRFRVADGRVHHDRFELHIGDTVLYTRGSVGFDQSLELVAQVPLQDAWLARDQRLAVFQGMTVEIPIGGTFGRPRVDNRAIEQLASQVVRQTANRLLEEGFNRGLQQLLGPKR